LSFAAAVLFFMVFACEACSFEYISDRGLRQHQLNCEEFLQADNEASTVDDALEKYRRKLQRKKQKAALSEGTGSGVCYPFIFYLFMILIIHCRMQTRPLQTRISHWNQNLNVKSPPPTTTLKTHLISNPQLSLTQRSMQLVVLFERSG
jgi:hypothetical protein